MIEREPSEREERIHEVVRPTSEDRPRPEAPLSTDTTVHREQYVRDVSLERRQAVFQASQFIWLILGLVDGLIGLRILLKLIGANPANAFASFIYNLSGLFVAPFASLVANPTSDGFALEVTSLVAMLFYMLVAWALVKTIWVTFGRSSSRTYSVYDREARS